MRRHGAPQCHVGQVIRIFAAGTLGTEMIEAPPGVDEAYDLLTADGMDPVKAAELALIASITGKDPVAWSRRVVQLRKTRRSMRQPPRPARTGVS